MKVLIVTSCGGKKNSIPMQAYKLYKSARIKAVFNRRNGFDMCILSSEYGLINAHDVVRPYERLMDEARAQELVPAVAAKIQDYECVVFFRGGARKAYFSCIKAACQRASIDLVAMGYANMGGINDLLKVAKLAEQGRYDLIAMIPKVELCCF